MGKYDRIEILLYIPDKNAITQLINLFLCILKRMKREFKMDVNLIEEIESKVDRTKY